MECFYDTSPNLQAILFKTAHSAQPVPCQHAKYYQSDCEGMPCWGPRGAQKRATLMETVMAPSAAMPSSLWTSPNSVGTSSLYDRYVDLLPLMEYTPARESTKDFRIWADYAHGQLPAPPLAAAARGAEGLHQNSEEVHVSRSSPVVGPRHSVASVNAHYEQHTSVNGAHA